MPRRNVVTGSITGRVLGEGGEPLSGVTVNASRRSISTDFGPPPTTTTDEEGQFVLDGLEPNVYSLGLSLPGYIIEPDPQPLSSRNRVRIGDSVTLRMLKGGVITGTVTDASGAPLIAANVRVIRVRDMEGRAAPSAASSVRDEPTDDRGVYRIYGLSPGIYVVSAGGTPMWSWWPVPFSNSTPTFYPSGTRDTASEINVRAGQETAGVDIRFRDERGQSISGTLVVPQAQPGEDLGGFGVELVHAATGTMLGSTWMSGRENERSFSFEGLSDGDYDVRAQQSRRSGQNSSSPPLRVTLKGADVTGLKLTLVPLASLSGTLFVEPLPEAERARGECKDRKARILPQETAIFARLDPQALPKNQPRPRGSGSEAVPDASSADGAFIFSNLAPGRYLVVARTVNFDSSDPATTRPPFWDAAERLKLRREAEAANVTLDLQMCQRVTDFTLRHPPAANK
ncbi:MAG: carboxypeptidase-like regulatory domain-containing protein [Acidobacteria bacterium]|nr:carboxypeptidase-like regulatory domain-containing protein [Acidobacteriota bacterium]